MLGPGQVEDLAVGVGPEPVVAVGAGQGALEAHVGELADRAGGEAVAAGLLPGEVLLLDQGHVPAGLGQPVGAGGAGRAAADDQDVVDRRAAGLGRCRRSGGRGPVSRSEAARRRHPGIVGRSQAARRSAPSMCPAKGSRGRNDRLWTIPADPAPALLGFLFAALSFVASALLAPRKRPTAAKLAPYECGIVPDRRAAAAVPGPLLPGGHDLHHLRHRDRLPLPVGGHLPPARARSGWSRCSSSPPWSSSRSSTW